MSLTPYRQTLALPGIKSLLVVATLARIPITASAVVLTLHVVHDLGRGDGAAGRGGVRGAGDGPVRGPARPATDADRDHGGRGGVLVGGAGGALLGAAGRPA